MMTAQQSLAESTSEAAPIEQITQLCAIYALVGQMAGGTGGRAGAPEESALAAAYRRAPSIARKRFEALADETAAVASAGARALLDRRGDVSAAATELRGALSGSFSELAELVGA